MSDFFSQTTTEADDKFAAACRRIGVEPVFYLYPQRGPAGEALHTGVAHIGNVNAAKQLVVISAMHGIEGFAGAALQLALLERFGRHGLPAGIGMLIVHAVNPWGMAWVRRENHDNVDVFRNFHYIDKPIAAHPLYDEIVDTYAADTWGHFDIGRATEAQATLAAKYGQDEIVSAVRRGQHHRPDGMTYHGRRACWSLDVFKVIVRQHLAGTAQVSVIDIHTGFGGFGEGMIIAYDQPGSDKYQRISQWFNGAVYTPGADADTPPHAFSPYGFIEDLCPGTEVTAKIFEYGSYRPDDYRDAFLAAHYFHQYGDVLSAEAGPWMKKFREYLYPDSEQWRDSIIAFGMDSVLQDISGLASWAVAGKGG